MVTKIPPPRSARGRSAAYGVRVLLALKLLASLAFYASVWSLRDEYPVWLTMGAAVLFPVLMVPALRQDLERSRHGPPPV